MCGQSAETFKVLLENIQFRSMTIDIQFAANFVISKTVCIHTSYSYTVVTNKCKMTTISAHLLHSVLQSMFLVFPLNVLVLCSSSLSYNLYFSAISIANDYAIDLFWLCIKVVNRARFLHGMALK